MVFFVVPDTPEWVARSAQSHFIDSGEPLLFHSDIYQSRLTAEETNGWFYLEDPAVDNEPPPMTWRKYSEQYVGMSIEEYAEEYGLAKDDWDKVANSETVFESWVEMCPRSETASGSAYVILDQFDLGRKYLRLDDLDPSDILGYVEFIDGEHPGSDYLGVRVSSPVALSALQYKLNELGSGIKLEIS